MFYRFNNAKKILPIIGSNNKYFVTINSKIKDEFMDDVPFEINVDGDLIVKIVFLNHLDSYRVIDILATHFKFMDHFDQKSLSFVEGFSIDGNKKNLELSNIGYRFSCGCLEVPGAKGFYYVPGFPRRAINSNGDLISTLTNSKLSWYVTKPQEKKNITGGYYTNRVEINNMASTMLRHRAMLLTFSKYPNNCDRLKTNHIDGVPGNDILTNLEWIDSSGNLNHAYKFNLRTQNKPVLARNIFSGKVTKYHSVSECGRDLNIKDRTINFRLEKSKFSSVCSFGYQFKYVDDERDWIIPEDPNMALQKAIQRCQVKVIDTIDKDEMIFSSITMASARTGVSTSTISNSLKNQNESIIKGFIFKSI